MDESHSARAQAFKRFRPGRLLPWISLGVCLCRGMLNAEPAKSIRLRNELIDTASTVPAQAPRYQQTSDQVVSGLYLIQFNGRPEVSWRVQLRALHADLVGFVPEDSFVARLDQVR